MLKMSRKPSKKLAKLVLASLLFTGGTQLAISPSVAEASEVTTTVTGCEWNMPSQKWIFNPEGSMIQSKNDDYAFIPADTNTTVLNLDGDWSISQSIFGHEEGGSSDVSGYTVNLNGPGIRVRLYGAKAIGGGNATDNHVKVITGTVNAKVAGGYSNKGSAIGNSVEIEGGTFSSSIGTGVAGGVSDARSSGNANQNTVIIKGGIFEKDVAGGLLDDPIGSGNANENRVTISGGEIGTSESGNIRGGYGSYGAANNNTVEISGGKINRNVYGGESNGGEASGNTVTISGNPTFAADSSIYGAVSRIGNTQNNTVNILASGLKIKSLFGGLARDGGTSSGNTLNIAATGVTAGSVETFQTIALSTGNIDIGNGEKAASSLKFQDGATVLSSSSFKNADGSNFTGTLDITKTDFTGTGTMTLLASSTDNNFSTLKLAFDDATKTSPKPLDATTPSVVVKSGGDETLSNKVVLTTTGGITHTVSLDTTNTYRNVLYTIAGDGNVTVTKVDLKNWDGATYNLTDAYKGTNVPVATGSFAEPTEDATILTAPTETFFGEVTGDRAYTSGASTSVTSKGVTISGNKKGGVKAEGTKLNYYAETMGVQSVALEAMTWNDGLVAAANYSFAGVTSIDAKELKFTFADADKAKLSKTSKMTLVDKATGLTASAEVKDGNKTQTVDFTVNGAKLTGTLTGTVSTAEGAVNYTATGMTLDIVDLANWDGATASAVPAGWTKNDSGVTVATENMNNLPETSKVILTTDTPDYFSDDKISGKNAYDAYDFTPSEVNKVTLSGKQSKGVKTSDDKSDLLYVVGKMDVSEISFGTMDWGTGRAATTDYDFAKVATVNASDLAFNFTDEQKADLSGTSTMTLLSDATNLAAGKKVTRSQQVDYSVANGVALTGTLTGTVATIAGAVNYNATGMTLDSVDLANWDGKNASEVPTGWTAADGNVAVATGSFAEPDVAVGSSRTILTAGGAFFDDANISGANKYDAANGKAFSETKSNVTVSGTQAKGVATADEGKSLIYKADIKKADTVTLGSMNWQKDAVLFDGSSETEYDYAAVTAIGTDKFDVTYAAPEKVAAGESMTLLKANATLKDMAEQTKATNYSYEPVSGVMVDAAVTGALAAKDGAVTFKAAENCASKLTFGDVEWKDSGALLVRPSNIIFEGAEVDTSKIKFTNVNFLDADQQMTLVSDFGNTPQENITGTTYMVGTAFTGEGSAEIDGKDLIFKTKTGAGMSEQTHKAVMAMEAGMALLASGGEHVGKALESLGDVANQDSDGTSVGVSIGGAGNRYETGSHVNVNSWNAALAIGAKRELKQGALEFGVFGEYGKGSYKLYNDDGGKGDGDAHYAGGGLLAKWTNKHDVYAEASFRLGRLSDSASDLMRDGAGNAYGYDVHANYFGAHVGVGKVFKYKGGKSLDVYGKYFYTKRDGIEFDAIQHYNLDSVASSVLRIGARYGSTDKLWNWYGGLAYEYEFDGEATGTVNGTAIRAASIKGSSVRGELGMKMSATKDNPWQADISIYGYGGKHRGFGGNVNVAYTF